MIEAKTNYSDNNNNNNNNDNNKQIEAGGKGVFWKAWINQKHNRESNKYTAIPRTKSDANVVISAQSDEPFELIFKSKSQSSSELNYAWIYYAQAKALLCVVGNSLGM